MCLPTHEGCLFLFSRNEFVIVKTILLTQKIIDWEFSISCGTSFITVWLASQLRNEFKISRGKGLMWKSANLNSIEWVAEHVSLELCGLSDKGAKVSDFECFKSSGMNFWLPG